MAAPPCETCRILASQQPNKKIYIKTSEKEVVVVVELGVVGEDTHADVAGNKTRFDEGW